jgi:translocation and assembly module TamB
MSNPNSDRNSKIPAKKPLWMLILSRGSITLGGIFVIGIIAGSWRLRSFIEKDLAPLAEQNLTTTLNRPVKLGKLQEFSLSGVRFGASSIPATATDLDRATVEKVDVSFDFLQLLFQRRLKLDVTLINPYLYVEQDSEGRWITTTITRPRKGSPIKTDLDKLRFRNGKLVLLPFRGVEGVGSREWGVEEEGAKTSPISPSSPTFDSLFPTPPVTFTQVNGVAQLLENNQLVKYEVAGNPVNGGSIFVRGKTRPKTNTDDLDLEVDDLLAADVTRLIKLPVELQTGKLKGNLRVYAVNRRSPLLYGTVAAQGVTVQVQRMPRAFVNAWGNLTFNKTEIKLENVTTDYYKIPLVANGTIDRIAGFNLAARVNAVSAANTQETLKLKFPLPVAANLNADLLLTGEISEPFLTGKINTIDNAKIDKVDFSNITTKFEFATRAGVIRFKDIQGKAAVGGDIFGDGEVQLEPNTPGVNFNLTAKNVPGDALAQLYNINNLNFQIGAVEATAQLQGPPTSVQTVVKWTSPNGTYPGTGETIVNPDRSVSFRNVALNIGGGKAVAAGTWVNDKWLLAADTSGIEVERFVNKEQLENVNIKGVKFDGRLNIAGTTAPFNIASIQLENAGIGLGGGRVAISNLKFNDQAFAAQLVANNVQLSRVLKEFAPILRNPLAGTFQIAGPRENLTLKNLQGTGNALLAVGGGTVGVNNIQLANGAYQARLLINGSDVQQLAQVPPQVQGNVTGDLKVAGTVDSFQLPAIRAVGQARLNVGNGNFNAQNIQLANGRYTALLQANNIPLQRYAKIPPQVQGGLNGLFNVAGTVESFKPENIELTGQGKLNVAGGIVTASNIQLNNGRYTANVDASGVELNRVNEQLLGLFDGKLQVTGSVNNFNIANLAAVGQVGFSRGLGGIEQPLTANVGWNGEKLTVERAVGRDVTANGYVLAKANAAGLPEITDLNLNVIAKNYNLQNLPAKLPNTIALVGKADFDGQITGKLPVPNLKGQIALRDLTVNKFAFESLLAGNITTRRDSGLQLDVAGKQDRIALNLDANNRPQAFAVKWQQAIATGQKQDDGNLAVKVDNFPLTALNLTVPRNPFIGGGINGVLTGNFQVNPNTFASNGEIAIAKPQVGRILGNSLNAKFSYDGSKLTLTESNFTKNNSLYAFAGTVIPLAKSTPQVQGKLSVNQGNIQDILTTLQLFEVQDLQRGSKEPVYGNAADLSNTQAVGLPNRQLLTQVLRLSEIQALLDKQQQQRRDASPVPALADLTGTFNGEVSLDTAGANGLTADFKLNGQNFIWGRADDPNRYNAKQIIAEGNFDNNILTLRPLRVELEKSLVAFSGSLGGKEQTGQLRVTNFPVDTISSFMKLPNQLRGNVSGTAAIAGSINNPQAKGELQLSEGTLNAKGIQSANASFSYNDGRLDFGSEVNVVGSDPVTINGGIPYRFPFADAIAENNQINLDVKVKNQGLAVINILTNQLAYEKGEGEINLKVQGTRDQLILNGIANLNNATFSAQALPGKLRDVAGQIKFDFDRIIVENLRGRFSRGKVEASGEIPVSKTQGVQINNPLSVNLDRLAINLKSLYQGGVSGKLQIVGSALDPLIGGDIKLSDGQVLLSETTTNTNNPGASFLKADTSSQSETDNIPTRFNNLQLTLGDNVRITRAPLLDFTATGSLGVTGSFTDPIPEGVIKLKKGGVNLFTTQFNLARGYEHTATFRKTQPRDPQLDIHLFAKVLDVIQSSDFNRSNTTGLAALEGVRVEAKIQGSASQLNENLELTSNPSRSQNEIVALLGGGFVETQGRGAGSTLGLINIAGSAVFNNFQSAFNQIGTAFGLSEFRLFPTIISEDPAVGRNFSSLELAAEAGVDITPKISASALKILTANDPVQWGVNYRINDEFRFRSSTNFYNDNRAVVEFQRRF